MRMDTNYELMELEDGTTVELENDDTETLAVSVALVDDDESRAFAMTLAEAETLAAKLLVKVMQARTAQNAQEG